MSIDPTTWMPPGMDPADVAALLSDNPDDPHRAAALAWEAHAAALPPDPLDGATSVSTGSQSVTYGAGGGGQHTTALQRAAWHRARSRARSVNVGPEFATAEGATPGVPTPLARQVQPEREQQWKAGLP